MRLLRHARNDGRLSTEHGFTLIELVVVIAIIGTLAAVAVPRFAPADTTVTAQADRLARDLRQVQNLAMTQGQTLVLDILSSTAYRVTDTSSTLITLPHLAELFQVALDNNVTISGTDTAFDSLGRPVAGGSLLATARVFTLTGTAATATVTVSPVTGFVTVGP